MRLHAHTFAMFITRVLVRGRAETAQTIAEYALLIAVIAIVVIVAAIVLGSSISAILNTTAHKV